MVSSLGYGVLAPNPPVFLKIILPYNRKIFSTARYATRTENLFFYTLPLFNKFQNLEPEPHNPYYYACGALVRLQMYGIESCILTTRAHTYDLLVLTHDLLLHTYDLLAHTYDIRVLTYDISYILTILAYILTIFSYIPTSSRTYIRSSRTYLRSSRTYLRSSRTFIHTFFPI